VLPAAFLIAEFLKISYLDVIWMATIPTCPTTFAPVHGRARRQALRRPDRALDTSLSLGQMTVRYGFHFTSLVAVIVFMVIGYSPMLAVSIRPSCASSERNDAERRLGRAGC
jgi:TRAP-type uncharacterized transport system fused permease subunit